MSKARYYVEVLSDVGEWLSYDTYSISILPTDTFRIRYRGKVMAKWVDGRRVR